ncbi:MAG: ABC transporter permease [Gemmatimonadetes bacterium]|nr:ABC transporter permease [Gemmatimonadota bacterium]
MIGYDLWQGRFGGSREILGKTVRANGVTRTVIGVMPEGFAFPERQQVWLPLEIDPAVTDRSEGPSYTVVGRLNPSTSMDEAKVQMASIALRLAQEYPESNEGVGVEVKAFTERFLGPEIYGLLYTMLGAALGVRLLRTYGFRGGGCS